ncbi:unnamed protein product [Rhodiola kirilowii]
MQNHTWELVNLPQGCKPLGSKWIFTKKMKVDGTVEKYKARLVIRGYRQKEGLDYFDTLSPVTRITSIRMIIGIAALRNLEIHQMDVKTAFLNGDLEEEIYMEQPEGCKAPGQERKVCKLILDKFGKDSVGVHRTPIDMNQHLSKNKGESISQVEYSKVIGSLMYLMNCTRPDIAYCVSRLARYTSNPGTEHWKAIVRVLRYLRFTRDHGLHYTRYPEVIEGYTDASWISDIQESKATSGYVFTLEGAVVSWKSSKQTLITRSTMKAEFVALDKCGEEAEWLRNFVEDIPGWKTPVPPICVYCDNQSTIGRAQNFMYNGKSRHIHRRHNTIRQLLSSGVISIDYLRSKENISDPLTKGLNKDQVEKTTKGMGLKPFDC